MSVRLSLAIETGGFTVPDQGPIVVFHPRSGNDLSALPQDRVVVVQPFRPDFEAFEAQGYTCVARYEGEAPTASVVFVTRAKALARDLVAQAVAMTKGSVLIDGAKTDGIDSILKEMKRYSTPSSPISKAHGKVFHVPGGAELLQLRPPAQAEIEGFMTAPGVFSADGVDPASALLSAALPTKLGRRIADLGAGWGYLSAEILKRSDVRSLHLVEADYIALECAKRNNSDERAQFHWADARTWSTPEICDCVVMNPPFHSGRAAEPALGQAFIEQAARVLAPSGDLWMVANRHLPYETTLEQNFLTVEEVAGESRFKVLHAARPRRHKG
ncbi:16S rRNA (guanine1207-N2)-methyltransferase [Epibacterium ulvae]|uniref:16S rRNA (Guanine1207-N2)-methyltransferase n=1 Tax=Epibacterium ulvae TaxID=1156985 RepID=A0A1G5PJG5_9RHOB|nr:class I SAM-dependent methyltransferase [Epibacterium ulvae]SCZ49655.1 16S rRNA (guanine1207-N2)-methyltransferase [Epibacterium ulvae]